MDKIEIINYSEDNKSFIKSLNYEWLEKYFSVEPNDELQLSNPQKEIIDKGGFIYYITYNGQIMGTATLISKEPGIYELGKMAITEKFQGKGIAHFLMQHCISTAKKLKARKIILYSNTKLIPAIQLYKKYGFYEVPLTDTSYMRSDIKMELMLL